MLRILYFSRDYNVHDNRFLAALAKTDLQIFFLRLENGSTQLDDRSLPDGIERISWLGGKRPARWQDGLNLLMDLKRVIRIVKPDLIQAGPLQRSAFLVALAGFRPLLSMTWGYDLIFDARRSRFWAWATRYTLKRSAAMLGDCNTVRQLAVSYGMPDERIVTFPWGIDLEHFHPGSRDRGDQGVFTLLSTRSWESIYGVDIIAQAFVTAARQHPGLRLVMLGGGSQAAALRLIFDQGGVTDRVDFPGTVGQADLPTYYQNADLYLSASHSDGTSISLLEAMACGCPVLTSNIPGNMEWVTPGVNGWTFPDGSAEGLVQGILHAAQNRHLLLEISQRAREVVEERGDWEKNFPKLLEAYKLALNQGD